jgi:hypothetical protein
VNTHIDRNPAAEMVRLGKLALRDFALLEPPSVRRILARPGIPELLGPGLGCRFDVLSHLVACCPGLAARVPWDVAASTLDQAGRTRARRALLDACAPELLRAKSPALFECLPWLDWDFGTVARRFPPWKTRLLLVGDSTSVTLTHCRRTAGVCVVEPLRRAAGYLERKARLLGVRRFRLIPTTAECLPLADRSHDLAIAGTGVVDFTAAAIDELIRVAENVLLVGTRPGDRPDRGLLTSRAFTPARLHLNPGRDQRPCWWRLLPLD